MDNMSRIIRNNDGGRDAARSKSEFCLVLGQWGAWLEDIRIQFCGLYAPWEMVNIFQKIQSRRESTQTQLKICLNEISKTA